MNENMNKQAKEINLKSGSGLFSIYNAAVLGVLAVGGYAVYRNRSKIMSFLDERGVKLPFGKDEVQESIKSLTTNFKGSIDHLTHGTTNKSDTEYSTPVARKA